MKPGDLVRVNLKLATDPAGRSLNGRMGIIMKPGNRGGSFGVPTLFVWWVLLDEGEMCSFEPESLEVVEAG